VIENLIKGLLLLGVGALGLRMCAANFRRAHKGNDIKIEGGSYSRSDGGRWFFPAYALNVIWTVVFAVCLLGGLFLAFWQFLGI